MHQELRLSDDQTLYYRYNPQADVLAVRFKPDFKAADERPLPAQPAISTSHDLEGGAALGLRISGVQQMLLQSLIRDAYALAAPALGLTASSTPQAAAAVHDRSAPEPVAAPVARSIAPPEALPVTSTVAQPVAPTEARPVATMAAPPGATPVASAAIVATGDDSFEEDDVLDDAADNGIGAETRRRRRRRRRRPIPGAMAADGEEAWVSIASVNRIAPPGTTTTADSPTRMDGPSPHPVAAPVQDADVGLPLPSLAVAQARPPAEPGDAYRAPMAATVAVETADEADDDRDAAVAGGTEPGADSDRRRRRRRRGRRGGEGAVESDAVILGEDDEDDLPGDPVAEAHWDDDGRPCPEAFAPLRLHPRVAHAIADLGFNNPTPIQVEAIPVALSGEDLVGLAQTGTGKTLAFVAPSLTRLLAGERPGNRPRMVILTPTRELAVQVALEAERLAAHTDLRVATIYGGVSMSQQTDDLRRGVDVVVATPGRILDHLRRRNVTLDAVEVLVLDEADRMLDMGFLPDVRAIIRQLPGQRQTMLFTATFPPEIESLSLEFQSKPRTVEIARRKPPESIDQRLYPVGRHLKAPLLVHLLVTDPSMDRVLVFTERKIDADVLARKLRQDGISVALMHGDRTQVDREKALAALKSHQVRVLVATNVAARGLDIEEISHVVNYDVPQSIDEYVHRIGRTARAESEGKAYSFVTLGDEAMISRIEAALGRQLPRVQAPGFDYDVTAPSWAKPSGDDVLAWLNKETSVVDRLRSLSRRRR